MTSTRTKLIVGSAGLVAGAGLLTAPALASAATTDSSHDMHLRAVSVSDTPLDLGAKGYSAGDVELGAANLTRGGAHVGWAVLSCTTARVGRASADQLCVFALHLPHGQLVAEGSVRAGAKGPGTFSLAITGGTGRYRTARGALRVTASNGSSVPLDVRLAG
jgi:hypothetical protein